MTTTKYFEKNGKIYGVSSKYEFGEWHHVPYVFTNLESAFEWLNTEEYDNRERELMSRSEAIALCGRKIITQVDKMAETGKCYF